MPEALELRPYMPGDAAALAIQPAQAAERANAVRMDAQLVEGPSWTVCRAGRPIACGGLVEMWPGRAIAWGLVATDAGPVMVALSRLVRAQIGANLKAWRRIEATACAEFKPARRWLSLLGFRLEARMDGYAPDGAAHWLFSRVRP
ncbi:hypothetical protein [Zavarzinia sp. CC-PAN008]|uniref:hypothetical protein n=1 Tax=Zavarzinia sp. CC-PAN008 TaxID=3243332 RepID=UPI003F742C84